MKNYKNQIKGLKVKIFRISQFLTLIIIIIAFLMCQSVTSVIAPYVITEEDEIALGNQFYHQIRADKVTYPPFNGDRRVIRFVDSLGKHIADSQEDRNIEFTFDIIDDDQVNAFAIPGGHVFVYRGLLENVRNTAELAGVLAHEIGHITKYHSRDRLVQQTFVNNVNTILFGDDSASISAAVTALLQNMAFLKYSRDKENQADSCSVVYTVAAEINPYGMKAFLSFLLNLHGDTNKILTSFSSHPPFSERINNIQRIIEKTSGVPAQSERLFEEEYEKVKELL